MRVEHKKGVCECLKSEVKKKDLDCLTIVACDMSRMLKGVSRHPWLRSFELNQAVAAHLSVV